MSKNIIYIKRTTTAMYWKNNLGAYPDWPLHSREIAVNHEAFIRLRRRSSPLGQRCWQLRSFFYPRKVMIQICIKIPILSIWVTRQLCRVRLIWWRIDHMQVTREMITPFVPKTLPHFAAIMRRRTTLWTRRRSLSVNRRRGKRIFSSRMGSRVPLARWHIRHIVLGRN